MKNVLFKIYDQKSFSQSVNSILSFQSFYNYLKQKTKTETTVKANLYKILLKNFSKYPELTSPLPVNNINKYAELLEMIYAGMTGITVEETEKFWALGTPVPDTIFYGTDEFYNLIVKANRLEKTEKNIIKKDQEKDALNFIYFLILEKCYGYDSLLKGGMTHSFRHEAMGYKNYFNAKVDARFIEVSSEENLPDLSFESIESHIHEGTILEYLSGQFFLPNFTFTGFSIISLVDITEQYAVQSIKNSILENTIKPKDVYISEITQALKSLAGNNKIDFGFFPFVRLNKKFLIDTGEISNSILISSEILESESKVQSLLEDLIKHPNPLFIKDVNAIKDDSSLFMSVLKKTGCQSFAMIPLYYNKELTGILEVYSNTEKLLTQHVLTKLDAALPYVAQIFKSAIDDFNSQILHTVNEKFTSIQPSVQWKFNLAARDYLRKKWNNEVAEIETVTFKKVYPLYGAIDIRNSTYERNLAVSKDMKEQFSILQQVLLELKQVLQLPVIDDILLKSKELVKELQNFLTADLELRGNNFFREEANIFLTQIVNTFPDTTGIIYKYWDALDANRESISTQRDMLEESVKLINSSIGNYLDRMNADVQKMYPSYYESFRTDGFEYDLFLGQSIAPDKQFDKQYLNNIRLLQLRCMASITKATHALLQKMQVPLQTTQLIFIHNDEIDISFRNDERKFDVEGGYNIRYEVIKKRIDKVLIKSTGERLTQPGKIAVVYYDHHVADEYLSYLQYLTDENVLHNEHEYLELEDLQGVSGLKALRVQVKFD